MQAVLFSLDKNFPMEQLRPLKIEREVLIGNKKASSKNRCL